MVRDTFNCEVKVKSRPFFKLGCVFMLLPICFSVGCGQVPVSGEWIEGSVTVDKQPLAEGIITFVPLSGTTGGKITATIVDGKYRIDAAEGLEVGKFRVEIMGLPPGIKAMAEGKHLASSESFHSRGPREAYREIDAEFNKQSKLGCTIVHGMVNSADFDVRYAATLSR